MYLTSFLLLFYIIFFISILLLLIKKNLLILTKKEIIVGFTAKVIAGCVYGYLFQKFYHGDDTWKLHTESLKEYGLLIADPWLFVKGIFYHSYQTSQYSEFFTSNASYWKNLPDVLLIKLLAVFNLLSNSSYYVNVVLFSSITFWGHYFLFRIFEKFFCGRRPLLFMIVFLFPPLLFWESGIRKDGLLFLFITGSIWFLQKRLFPEKKVLHMLIALLFLFFALLIRNFVGLSLIVSAMLYFILRSFPFHRKRLLLGFTCFITIAFFSTSILNDKFNFPFQVAKRQEAFLLLKGGSYVPTPPLQASVYGYIKNFPNAVDHVLFRPYISDMKSILIIISAFENLLLYILLLSCFFFFRKNFLQVLKDPFLISLLFFSIINYLLIGYTVPFLGAIVRYRVIFETLVICCLLSSQTRIIKK
jgi:hypothetical protein